MKPEFRKLRARQLGKSLEPLLGLKNLPRPQKGWLRAIREASGITVREFASRLGTSPQVPFRLEQSEADYRITLKSLRDAADALGFELVYALVPKEGNLDQLLASKARNKATEDVLTVEHTMALENQAVGNVTAKIEEETDRLLKRG
jgi:predicted DNA-binding mobile mystery protein A